MSRPEAFLAYLGDVLPRIDAELDRLLPAVERAPRRLHEAMRYCTFAGGKRLRPALTLLAAEACGAGREVALAPGAAIEMIHTYSLVHDDLPALDDDDLRRGRATVHRRYDEATAVLAGDALLTLGLTTLAAEPADAPAARRRAAVALVGEAIGTAGMIGGQMEDVEAEAAWPADPEAALERIHRGKTAALLAASLELGALHAGADAETRARFRDFGFTLGLMFQIADDILDVVGTAGALGKTAGKDARAHKLTYPALYDLPRSRQELERLRGAATARTTGLPGRHDLFRSLADFLAARDH